MINYLRKIANPLLIWIFIFIGSTALLGYAISCTAIEIPHDFNFLLTFLATTAITWFLMYFVAKGNKKASLGFFTATAAAYTVLLFQECSEVFVTLVIESKSTDTFKSIEWLYGLFGLGVAICLFIGFMFFILAKFAKKRNDTLIKLSAVYYLTALVLDIIACIFCIICYGFKFYILFHVGFIFMTLAFIVTPASIESIH